MATGANVDISQRRQSLSDASAEERAENGRESAVISHEGSQAQRLAAHGDGDPSTPCCGKPRPRRSSCHGPGPSRGGEGRRKDGEEDGDGVRAGGGEEDMEDGERDRGENGEDGDGVRVGRGEKEREERRMRKRGEERRGRQGEERRGRRGKRGERRRGKKRKRERRRKSMERGNANEIKPSA
jgi:hypothetical protein